MPSNDYHFFQDKVDGKANQIYDYAPSIASTGDLRRTEGIDVAILSIRTLLLTPLGHYPFDPQYGSLLYKKLFEMADNISKDEIEYEVTQRVRQYEDRVKVVGVDSYFAADGKTIIVNVDIERDGVPGKVSLNFAGNNRMFGLEDDITAGLK
jgi:phage baseplate assembly protein W